jgi:hypothetical protein
MDPRVMLMLSQKLEIEYPGAHGDDEGDAMESDDEPIHCTNNDHNQENVTLQACPIQCDAVCPHPHLCEVNPHPGTKYQLPLTLVYGRMWTDPETGEEIPIYADLLFITTEVVLHYIRHHPRFPPQFNGKYFTRPSQSSLHIRPMELNGFQVWYVMCSDGSCVTLDDAWKTGFINSPLLAPSEPKIPSLKKKQQIQLFTEAPFHLPLELFSVYTKKQLHQFPDQAKKSFIVSDQLRKK